MKYRFFSNLIRDVQKSSPEASYETSQFISIDCVKDTIHLFIHPFGNVYDGIKAHMLGASTFYVCEGGNIVLSIQIVAGRVINVAVSNVSYGEVLFTRVYEQIIDYTAICKKLNTHIIARDARKIIIRNDRGQKPHLLGLPQYSVPFIKLEYQEELNKYNSYYLDWVRYYTIGSDSELPIMLQALKDMQDTNILEYVMQTNRMQCLGLALSMCELMDRVSIHPELTNRLDCASRLLELAFFSVSVYLACYEGQDPLIDSELFAIRARFNTLCGNYMPTVLLRRGITNLVLSKNMYVADMYLASKSCPNEMKTHYYQNALMMHQNQTVADVSNDRMDENFIESINLGINCTNSMLHTMSEMFKEGSMAIDSADYARIVDSINEVIAKSEANSLLNQVKAFCVVYQIDPFSLGTESSSPLFGFTKNLLSAFLDNIKVKGEYSGKEIGNGRYTLQLRNRKDCSVENDILWISIIYNSAGIIEGVNVGCFCHGYELKKSIDKSHLFHGFVCQTSVCFFDSSPQSVMLLPYPEDDVY